MQRYKDLGWVSDSASMHLNFSRNTSDFERSFPSRGSGTRITVKRSARLRISKHRNYWERIWRSHLAVAIVSSQSMMQTSHAFSTRFGNR